MKPVMKVSVFEEKVKEGTDEFIRLLQEFEQSYPGSIIPEAIDPARNEPTRTKLEADIALFIARKFLVIPG